MRQLVHDALSMLTKPLAGSCRMAAGGQQKRQTGSAQSWQTTGTVTPVRSQSTMRTLARAGLQVRVLVSEQTWAQIMQPVHRSGSTRICLPKDLSPLARTSYYIVRDVPIM